MLLGVLVLISIISVGCLDDADPASARPAPPPAERRAGVAVLEFENSSQIRGVGRGMAERLDSELLACGWFDVITRRNLDDILGEHFEQQQAFVDDSTAVEMGKVAGVDYMIMGNVINVSAEPYALSVGGVGVGATRVEVDVSIQMISVQTGRLTASPYVSASNVSPQIAVGRAGLPRFAYGDGSDYSAAVEKAIEEAAVDAVNQLIAAIE